MLRFGRGGGEREGQYYKIMWGKIGGPYIGFWVFIYYYFFNNKILFILKIQT
jgi:hypothetical protein